MFIDFRNSDIGDHLQCDICIIGAGAAGITIANELLGTSLNVLLLESGGLDFDARIQQLYDANDVGITRQPMIQQRLRLFGGTTNHWDGRCAPFDPIDFEQRDWVPMSGWPLSGNELAPFYKRAYRICDLGEHKSDQEIFQYFNIPKLPTDRSKLIEHTWQFSPPTRFGTKFQKPLQQARNIKVLLHANAIDLQLNAAGTHIERVAIKSMENRHTYINAKTFVLACGGLENPRILLNSSGVMRNGVGNQNDLVGRYLMDHLRSKHVVAPLDDPYALGRIMNIYRGAPGDYLVGMRLSEELQRETKILNAGMMTYMEGGDDSSLNATIRLVKSSLKGKPPENAGADILNVLRDLDGLLMNARRQFLRPGTEALLKTLTTVVCESEQAPNPHSRVYLADEPDALGMRKLNVNWQLSELDLKTTQVMVNTLASQLSRHFRARIRIPEWISFAPSDWAHHFKDVSHPTGTTRMSADEKTGVVDQNCRVHGVDNLYIAGSSVFPTTGQSNPTLTIVSLALRLADHIKMRTAEQPA